MAFKLKSDEINKLHTKYFEVMEISNEQKLERIELADLLDDMFIFLFVYLGAVIAAGTISVEDFYEIGEQRYIDLLKTYGVDFDKYPEIEIYVEQIVKDIVDSTIRDPKRNAEQRAIECAEDQSNTIFNYMEFQDAKNAGKTKKTWIAEMDSKTRKTHADVDMLELPIDEPFLVGDSQMMFPKDSSLGANPREVINCRCSIVYS